MVSSNTSLDPLDITTYTAPHQGTAPPRQGTAPPHQGTAPPHQGTAPPHEGTAPPHEGTAPPHQGTAPPRQGTAPPPLEGTAPPHGSTHSLSENRSPNIPCESYIDTYIPCESYIDSHSNHTFVEDNKAGKCELLTDKVNINSHKTAVLISDDRENIRMLCPLVNEEVRGVCSVKKSCGDLSVDAVGEPNVSGDSPEVYARDYTSVTEYPGEGKGVRSGEPSKLGKEVRSGEPSKLGKGVRSGGPSKLETEVRPGEPLKLGKGVRPGEPSKLGKGPATLSVELQTLPDSLARRKKGTADAEMVCGCNNSASIIPQQMDGSGTDCAPLSDREKVSVNEGESSGIRQSARKRKSYDRNKPLEDRRETLSTAVTLNAAVTLNEAEAGSRPKRVLRPRSFAGRGEKRRVTTGVYCPVCGLSLLLGKTSCHTDGGTNQRETIERHLNMEIDKVDSIFNNRTNTRSQRRRAASMAARRINSVPGGTSLREREQKSQQIDDNIRRRHFEMQQRYSSSRSVPSTSGLPPNPCPVCYILLTGTEEERTIHVERCLLLREDDAGQLEDDIAARNPSREALEAENATRLDLASIQRHTPHSGLSDLPENVETAQMGNNLVRSEYVDSWSEYTVAGQERTRVTPAMSSALAQAVGFTVVAPESSDLSAQSQGSCEEEIDVLVVDDSEETAFGTLQFTEADVIPVAADSLVEAEEQGNLRRAMLRGADGEDKEEGKPVSSKWLAEQDSGDGASREEAKCLICMEYYEDPLVSTQCWHVLCKECWMRSLGVVKLCPQCKTITSSSHLRKIYL